MTPIEIMALIVIGFALIKIVVLFINPSKWMKVVEAVFAKPALTLIVAFVWAAVVLVILLQEMTIVHIFASMLFLMPLFLMGFAAYGKDTTAWAKKMLKDKKLMKKSWLLILVWIVLLLWVIYTIFFL
ncbi:MAG: hypothetical protein ABIJ18_02110 [archaeon]